MIADFVFKSSDLARYKANSVVTVFGAASSSSKTGKELSTSASSVLI